MNVGLVKQRVIYDTTAGTLMCYFSIVGLIAET